MSGTSLDGVDVVIADVSGQDRGLRLHIRAFYSEPYTPSLRALLQAAATAQVFDVTLLCQLNVRLAHVYADAIRAAAQTAGIDPKRLDLVGSHGQTVRHVPSAQDCAGLAVASTWQIGDPSVLAQLLGVPVVGEFRQADMALGGQGAPLVPYFDYVIFGDDHETRGCLNLGGIANLTILPAGSAAANVYGFDTGPANMVIDALAQALLGQPYDKDGAAAARGTVNCALLVHLLEDPFLRISPPKSTGRELFGPEYVSQLLHEGKTLSPEDLIATTTAFTAASVHRAYESFVARRHRLDRLVVSGGGVYNQTLLRMLKKHFGSIPVVRSSEFGIDEDAKEALCFAVLAHETANGHPSGMPSVTGAKHPAILGKICPPSPAL